MTREEQYIEFDERINRYLRNQMSDDERLSFEQEVDQNQELRERLVATALLVQGIAQEGMRREGGAQLDAIRQMSQEEFQQAIRRDKGKNKKTSLYRWIAGIAAVLAITIGIKSLFITEHQMGQAPEMAQERLDTTINPTAVERQTKPTLASLADEYNKPFKNEPDAFADIREQIHRNGSKDMMAVVYDIDKVELPIANHGPKGADDEEVYKETQQHYADCTHWYKALAYLKANDKESAITELKKLIDHGTVEELVNRATDLLKKLEQ